MMINFPNEIINKIFDHLPPSTLYNAARVNHQWSYITRTLGMRQLNFLQFDDASFENMIDYIEIESPTEDDGTCIKYLLVLSHHLLPNYVFRFIEQLCPNVISFDYDQDLLLNASAITTNTGAQQHYQHRFYSEGWLNTIAHLPACHRFQRSWLIDTDFCQRLKTLYIQHGYDPLLFKYARNRYYGLRLPNLQYLDTLTLHSSFKFAEKPISHIHRQCPRLATLNLYNTSLACVFHRNPSSRVSSLTELTLENVVFLHYHAFLFFPKKYPNVQTFTLSTFFKQYDQKSNKQRYPHSLHFYMYHMIVGFRRLKKLTLHLYGFGTRKHIMNRSHQHTIQDHFYQHSSRCIEFDFICFCFTRTVLISSFFFLSPAYTLSTPPL